LLQSVSITPAATQLTVTSGAVAMARDLARCIVADLDTADQPISYAACVAMHTKSTHNMPALSARHSDQSLLDALTILLPLGLSPATDAVITMDPLFRLSSSSHACINHRWVITLDW
jgi:hypothetical protein